MTEIGNQEGKKKDIIRAQAQHETPRSSRKSSSEKWEWSRESIVRNWWGWLIKVITDDRFPDLLEKSFSLEMAAPGPSMAKTHQALKFSPEKRA